MTRNNGHVNRTAIPRIEDVQAWLSPDEYTEFIRNNMTLFSEEEIDFGSLAEQPVGVSIRHIEAGTGDLDGTIMTIGQLMRNTAYDWLSNKKYAHLRDAGIEISKSEMDALFRRGYDIVGVAGSGATRQALRAVHWNGDVMTPVIIKRPKALIDPRDSVTAAINVARKDVNAAEVVNTRDLVHPAIARTIDSFMLRPLPREDEFGNGGRCNVEYDYGGQDLESRINERGPVTIDEHRFEIASGIVNGLGYLHREKGIVHRDLKPSNVILAGQNQIVITDLQNAGKIGYLGRQPVCTRGGTPFTCSEQLNALMQERSYAASERDDLHALGTTLYFMLTGKHAFPYTLKSDPHGKSIRVKEKEFGVRLEVDGSPVEEISSDYVLARKEVLEQEMQKAKVPRKWRTLVQRCFEGQGQFRAIYEVQKALESMQKPFGQRLKEATTKMLPWAGLAALTSGVLLWAIYGWKHEPAPKLRDLMSPESYVEYSLENIQKEHGKYALTPFVHTMEEARDKLSKLEQDHWLLREDELVPFVERQYMDVRFGTSLIRSGFVIGSDSKYADLDWGTGFWSGTRESALDLYKKDGDERVYPGFVPEQFVRANTSQEAARRTGLYWEGHNLDSVGGTERLKSALDYARLIIGQDHDRDGTRDVIDGFAGFYSTTADIASAKAHAFEIYRGRGFMQRIGDEKTRALPYIAWNGGLSPGSGGTQKEGWGYHLPPHQRDLIDTALGLYLLTDEQGHIHWDRIPDTHTTVNVPAGSTQEETILKSGKK